MPKSVPSFVDVFPCSYKVSNCSIFLGPFHLTLRVARITFDPAPVIGDYKTLLPVQDLVRCEYVSPVFLTIPFDGSPQDELSYFP